MDINKNQTCNRINSCGRKCEVRSKVWSVFYRAEIGFEAFKSPLTIEVYLGIVKIRLGSIWRNIYYLLRAPLFLSSCAAAAYGSLRFTHVICWKNGGEKLAEGHYLNCLVPTFCLFINYCISLYAGSSSLSTFKIFPLLLREKNLDGCHGRDCLLDIQE